jgi:hypothetical protein
MMAMARRIPPNKGNLARYAIAYCIGGTFGCQNDVNE